MPAPARVWHVIWWRAAWQPLCGVAHEDQAPASHTRTSLSSRPPAEILQANDLLTQGVLLYKQVMEGRVTSGDTGTGAAGDVPVPRGMC